MQKKIKNILIALISGSVILALTSLFTVYETEKILVLQLGEYKRTIEQPGLNWKLPIIQKVIRYDRRLQGDTLLPLEVTAGDQKKSCN